MELLLNLNEGNKKVTADSKQINKDKKAIITEKLKNLGVPKEEIDGDMICTIKKICYKIYRLRAILDNKHINEERSEEIIKNISLYATEKDLSKIKECQIDPKLEHEGCCRHCYACHHSNDDLAKTTPSTQKTKKLDKLKSFLFTF